MQTLTGILLGFSLWDWSADHVSAIALGGAVFGFAVWFLGIIVTAAKWHELNTKGGKTAKKVELALLFCVSLLTLWLWKATDVSTAKSEAKLNRALTNSELAKTKIEEGDPLKQKFYTVTASVALFIKGTNTHEYAMAGKGGHPATLYLSSHAEAAKGDWMLHLVADTWQCFGNPEERDYYIEFTPDAVFPLYNVRNAKVEIIDSLDTFRMTAFFLPFDAEITKSSIELVVNSNVRRKFDIKPHKYWMMHPGSPINLTNDIVNP